MFGFQHVAPVCRKKLVTENGSQFTSTMNKVSALLTRRAMIAMNKAVASTRSRPPRWPRPS